MRREAIAGVTTFLTMSYIMVVNPSILSTEGSGLRFSAVMTATVLLSALTTLLMGCGRGCRSRSRPGWG